MLFLLAASVETSSVLAQSAPIILEIATYQYADNDRVKNIRPFARHFADVCGCRAEVKSYPSVEALLTAMKEGKPAIVFMNTFGYLLLRQEEHPYQPLAALRLEEGAKSTYRAAIVANRALGIGTLKEMANQASSLSLLLVNPGSTSGNLVPRLGLLAAGIANPEDAFREVNYSRNHALTLKMVAEGKADVGAFGAEEYGKLQQMEPALASNVNLLWKSDDIPLGPVVFHASMPRQLRGCLQTVLSQLHLQNAVALEAVKAGWTEALNAHRYEKISDKDYLRWLKTQGAPDQVMPIIKQFAQ